MNTAVSFRLSIVAILLYSVIVLSIVSTPVPAHADSTGAVLTGAGIGFVGGIMAGQALGGGSFSNPLNATLGGSFGMAADAQCIAARDYTRVCNTPPDKTHPLIGGLNCPCHDPLKPVSGMCVMANKCLGTTAAGLGGVSGALSSSLNGLLGQIAQQLVSKLIQGGSGSGSSGGGSSMPGCTPQQTSDINTYNSNPQCYYYVPSVSSSLNGTTGTVSTDTSVSDQLLNALGGGSTDTAINTDTNVNTDTNTNVGDLLNQVTGQVSVNSASTTASTTLPLPTIVPNNTASLIPGVSGDIKVLDNGATVLAGSTDITGNTTVAGFIGSDTFSGQSQGVVGRLCQNRPWATNFLSSIIPPTFFDGLCTLRGYQVGTPPAAQQAPVVTVTQTVPKPSTSVATTSQTGVNVIPPKADIWASPASVTLGSRTSVFWNTQGVVSCSETSPDGSFSQATLSGGASTVPITAATVFTISCIAPDGSHVTDDVTVNLSI